MCFNEPIAGHSGHAEVSACLQRHRLARLGKTSCSDWIRKLGLIGLKFSQDNLSGCRMFPISTSSFLVHGHCPTAGFLFHICTDLFLDQLYSLSPEPSNTRLLGGYRTSLFNCYRVCQDAMSQPTFHPIDCACHFLLVLTLMPARKTLMLNESL